GGPKPFAQAEAEATGSGGIAALTIDVIPNAPSFAAAVETPRLPRRGAQPSIGGDEHSAARRRGIIEAAACSVSSMKPGLQALHQFGDSREQHAISDLDESMAERWGEMPLAAAARTCGSCLRSCRPAGKLGCAKPPCSP